MRISTRILTSFGLVFALAAAILSPQVAHAQENLVALSNEYNAIFNHARKGVVAVTDLPPEWLAKVRAPRGLTSRSNTNAGFVIEGGYVVTYAEAFLDKGDTSGKSLGEIGQLSVIDEDGVAWDANVVGHDLRNLLLLLKLADDDALQALQPLKLIDTDAPPIGTTVASVGNAFDSIVIDGTCSFAVGSLSDVYRLNQRDPYNDERPMAYRGNLLEFEGAINPGDQGGPLLDLDGRVIGMMTGHTAYGRQQGTAVPATQLKVAIEALISGQELPQPALGFSVAPHNEDGLSGKRVTKVAVGSAAEAAGLSVGDVILNVDGSRVESDDTLGRIIGWGTWRQKLSGKTGESNTASYGLPPGSRLTFVVKRGDAFRTVEMTAGGLGKLKPWTPAKQSLAWTYAQERLALSRLHRKSVVSVFIDRTSRSGGRNKTLPRSGRKAFLDLTIGPNTGVIVSESGDILVCDSILGGFPKLGRDGKPRRKGLPYVIERIYVTLWDGRCYSASIKGRDRGSDLALLKIDATGLTPVSFANDDLKRGESLQVLGRCYSGSTLSSRRGICSALLRENASAFQLDAKVGSADLGSLVIDPRGNPVGIVSNLPISRVGQASGVAYASHNATVRDVLPMLLRGEFRTRPPMPYLGISANSIYVDRPGLRIATVAPGTGAAFAGLKEGDVILKADGKDMNEFSDLRSVIRSKKPGDTLTLIIERTNAQGEDVEMEKVATLGTRDE